ncbi:restriction endonuclease subunit S [Catenibacterium sp.]|uniref:restriction endonuclease subunit S n=2 Tax=Catenibacterium sp. TaxID=2049022 RepID=UPI003FD7F729
MEKSRKPKIRFKGYNDDWEQRKFSDLVQIERGGSPRPIDDFITDSPDGLNWVKIGDAPAQGNYITKTAEKIKPEGLSKTREVHPGDLTLSNSMSFGKPYIMGIDGCIHDGWLLIRNTYKVFDLTFLCHLLGTPQMIIQYKSLAAGSTVNNLNKELVGNTVVTIPTIKEQRVLGQYLETLDNLITLHQRKLEKLMNVKKSMLEKMFPKQGSVVPEIRFCGFTDAWEQRKVAEITTFHKQGFYTTEDYDDDKKYYLLRGTDLTENKLRLSGTPKIDATENDYNAFKAQVGDFLIVRSGTVGTYGIVYEEIPAIFGSYLIDFRFDHDEVTNEFFGYFYQSDLFKNQLRQIIQQSANTNINAENIKSTVIQLPNINEQKEIGVLFEKLDNVITLHQRKPNFYTGGYYAE